MTISILSSGMEKAKADFLGNAERMGDSRDSMRASFEALFGSWEGTGSAGFRSACDAVEGAMGMTCGVLSDLGNQVEASARTFEESDGSVAKSIEKLG
ncbi:hypothetical protein B5F40_15615 [Gordonibacter sp. An230]|uniref:WXG100 family type VII secretion target n=1 Tax=Gordonibacter sp. An230 TaxID=1965592 RepID=UPI000B39BA70|nr:WXG100 family type VII secretion target [Gordonibacter sp. An230]OUO85827.1 hypothetical protein B5F40_15615 [Gordonibacter sp. An230]